MISEDNGSKKAGDNKPVMGDKVIKFAKEFINSTSALKDGSVAEVNGFNFSDETLSM